MVNIFDVFFRIRNQHKSNKSFHKLKMTSQAKTNGLYLLMSTLIDWKHSYDFVIHVCLLKKRHIAAWNTYFEIWVEPSRAEPFPYVSNVNICKMLDTATETERGREGEREKLSLKWAVRRDMGKHWYGHMHNAQCTYAYLLLTYKQTQTNAHAHTVNGFCAIYVCIHLPVSSLRSIAKKKRRVKRYSFWMCCVLYVRMLL